MSPIKSLKRVFLKFFKKPKRILFLITFSITTLILVLGHSTRVEAVSPFLYWPVPSNQSVACSFGCYGGHVGNDIGVNQDNTTPIYAAAAGTVESVDRNRPFGANRQTSPENGNNVTLKHDIGGEIYYTRYLHLTTDIKVAPGQSVSVGKLLGYGSNSGFTCGTQPVSTGGCLGYSGSYWHLHFQVNKSCNNNSCAKDPFAENWWIRDANGKLINATDVSVSNGLNSILPLIFQPLLSD